VLLHLVIDNIVQVGICNGDIISVGISGFCTDNPHYGFVGSWLRAQNQPHFTFTQIFSYWGLGWCLKNSRSFSQSLVIVPENYWCHASATIVKKFQDKLTVNCHDLLTLNYSNSE